MVDMRCAAFGEVKAFSETEKAIFHLSENFERLLNIIEQQEQRIEQLEDAIFTIAPELETIDLMANDEQERRDMIARYMNLDEDYLYERNRRRDYDWGHDGGHRSQNDSLMDGMEGRASDGGSDFRNDNSHSSKADDSEYRCVKHSDMDKSE